MTSFESPEVVICLGLPRSGSTWVYNVARELLGRRYPEGPIACGFSDDLAVLRGSHADSVRCYLVKAHNLKSDSHALLGSGGVRVIISTRDPRDAVASLMERFRVPFQDAAGAVYSSARAIAETAEHCHHLLLRYEDEFPSDPTTLQRIQEELGCTQEAPILQEIYHVLSRSRIAEKLHELSRRGAFRPGPALTTWDPETQWHPDHLGDGRIGKYRELLTVAQIRRLEEHFGFFMSRFSYGCPQG